MRPSIASPSRTSYYTYQTDANCISQAATTQAFTNCWYDQDMGTGGAAASRPRWSGLLPASVVVAVLAVGASTAVVLLRAPSRAGPATTDLPVFLPAEMTGTAELHITPAAGGELHAAAVTVAIEPGAVAASAEVAVGVAADGSVHLTMDPPQRLALPARVTLPMPPGAELGDDPALWPAVVLEHGPTSHRARAGASASELEHSGEAPHLLTIDSADSHSLTVALAHFSTLRPMTRRDAARRLAWSEEARADLADPNAPRDFTTAVKLPETSGTSAETSSIILEVAANTGGPTPRTPVITNGKLASEWSKFATLHVMVEGRRSDGDPTDKKYVRTFVITNGKGAHKIDLTSTMDWLQGNSPYTSLVVTLKTAEGRTIAATHVAVPIGKMFASYQCRDQAGKEWATISYIRDPASAHHTGKSYTPEEAPADPSQPAMAIDTCKVLIAAYPLLAKVLAVEPSVPMSVVLQPWRESSARYTNGIVEIRTSKLSGFHQLRSEVTHELTHMFQFKYSLSLFKTGLWFHETSAEYHAHWIWDQGGANLRVDEFAGGREADAEWIHRGFTSPIDTDNYAGASFLAYLASTRGLSVSGLWKEGKNSESWLTTIDRALGGDGSGPKLSAAWAEFAKAYLIDHALWPGSTGWGQVNVAAALSSTGSTIAFSTAAHLAKKKVRLKPTSLRAPPLSGGGFSLAWRPGGGEAATFVVKLEPRSGAGYWGRFPGNGVDGRPGIELAEVSGGGQVQRAQLTDVFVLGAKEDRPEHDPPLSKERAARYVYYYTDTSPPVTYNTSRPDAQRSLLSDTGLRFEAWAIPEVTGVTTERVPPSKHLLKLTWSRSALEQEKDLFGGYEVLVRVPKREDKVLDKLDADTLEYQVDAAKQAAAESARLCVRVVDVDGTAGPAGCTSLGGSWKLVRRGIASMIKDRTDLSDRVPLDFEKYDGPAGVLDAEFADDCEHVVGHLEFTFPEELKPDEFVTVPYSLTGSGQLRDEKKCWADVEGIEWIGVDNLHLPEMPAATGLCYIGPAGGWSRTLDTRPGSPGSATFDLWVPSFESFKKKPPIGQATLPEDERDLLIVGCDMIVGIKRVRVRHYYAFDSGAGL